MIYLVLGSLVTRLGFAQKQKQGLAEARGGLRGPANVWGSAFTGTVIALLIGAGIGSATLLLIGFAASFAAKLADTFGSEIGKRWGRTIVLITSLRRVPAGTEESRPLKFVPQLQTRTFSTSNLLGSRHVCVLDQLGGKVGLPPLQND